MYVRNIDKGLMAGVSLFQKYHYALRILLVLSYNMAWR